MTLEPVAILFALLGLGWVAGRVGPFGKDAVEHLNRFAFLVAFPALIFTSLWKTPFQLLLDWRPYAAALLGVAAGALLALAVARATRAPPRTAASAVFGALWGNAAYLGVPLVALAYGGAATGQAAAIAGLFVVTSLPLGMVLVARAEGHPADIVRGTVTKAPLVWAALLGIIGSAAREAAELPFSFPILDVVAGAATPVALFALGAFLSTVGARAFRPLPSLLATSGGKLLLAPAVAFGIAYALGLEGVALSVTVLQAAAPSGITYFVATKELEGDAAFAAGVILVSTAASAVTLSALLAGLPR